MRRTLSAHGVSVMLGGAHVSDSDQTLCYPYVLRSTCVLRFEPAHETFCDFYLLSIVTRLCDLPRLRTVSVRCLAVRTYGTLTRLSIELSATQLGPVLLYSVLYMIAFTCSTFR